MGSNYVTSGYANIEEFVKGMNTIPGQVYAFVNHVSHTPTLLNAIRTKNSSSFARYNNGSDYKKNNYDVHLSRNYDRALHNQLSILYNMKIFNLVLSLLVISPIANASITLSKPHSNDYEKTIIQEAQHEGLERVELDKNQTFDLIKNGKVLGTLVQGKGWVREVQPVCFIAWTKDSKKSDQFIQTIGQGDWETVGCHKVDSVGLISKKDDPATKVAVIYTTEAPYHYANDYYILGLKSGDNSIYYDQSVTENFQNSYIKNLSELRKAYQK